MNWFERQRRAVVEAIGPGSRLLPGETFLLSVDGEGSQGSAALWRLEEGAPDAASHVAFHGRARRSLEIACALARLEVPLLAAPGSLLGSSVHWRAESVLAPGDQPIHRLDGASFGLGMVLAASSRLIGIPLPSTLLTTAAVSESGRIEEVDGLASKLGLLAHDSLSHRELTCVVAASQEPDARRLAPANVRIVGVDHLDEAIELAFEREELERRLRQRWSSPAERESATSTFFRLAVDGSNLLLGWQSLARGAALLGKLAEDDPWSWKVEVAARIARRHVNEPVPLVIDDGRLASLPRPRRIQLLAHDVQAAADAVSPDWEKALDRARASAPRPGDEHAEDLQLLGAIGRALAAWGRYDEAEIALRRALRGWLALDAEPRCTYALCELLRVRGVTEAPIDTDLADAVLRFRRDSRPDMTSRAYVRAALGRALVQLGRHADAVTELEGGAVAWEHCPPHLQAGRTRWLAQALHPTEPDGAARQWADLESLALHKPQVAGFAWRLAVLDRATLAGSEDSEAARSLLTSILANPRMATEAERIFGFTGARDPSERARAIRRHWRY